MLNAVATQKTYIDWENTVIKSVALPKLIYVLSSLSNPPKDTIKQIEKNHVSIYLGRKT